MKNINERCPLSGECERNKCDYVHKEIECLYYFANATPDNCIKDQENIRSAEYDDESAYDDEVSEIVMIQIDKLFPHPDNPRKDVGDVAELAESIKANGVLQNLTVIPGHYSAEGEFEPEGFTVIIGHRRLAAAKLAGIKAVPCYIAFMDIEQQISTMLTENMQRADLTVYEQAKAFQQLSLDLGMSVSEIAEKSGFSETTVRRRTKLADLDEKEFKKACSRGATLFDFAELDKIESEEDKQYCLKYVGTPNFKNTLKAVLEKQKLKVRMAEWLEVIKTFATERTGAKDDLKYVGNYSYYNMSKEVKVPEDASEVNYYYFVSDREIDLYTERDKDKEAQEEAERAERRAKEAAEERKYSSVSERHYELRKAFVKGLSSTNCHSALENVAEFLASVLKSADNSGYYAMRPKLDIDLLREGMNIPDSISGEEDARFFGDTELISCVSSRSEKLIFCLAYCAVESKYAGYYAHEWNRETQKYEYIHKENDRLDLLYSVLCDLGYEMSDEEKAMQDGTHELFYKGEPDAE